MVAIPLASNFGLEEGGGVPPTGGDVGGENSADRGDVGLSNLQNS